MHNPPPELFTSREADLLRLLLPMGKIVPMQRIIEYLGYTGRNARQQAWNLLRDIRGKLLLYGIFVTYVGEIGYTLLNLQTLDTQQCGENNLFLDPVYGVSFDGISSKSGSRASSSESASESS